MATQQEGQQIQLTELEAEIFGTLLQVTKQAELGTTLRCAGGWVRDKLLGRDSDDIDIALDNMMGAQFAEKVNEHMASSGKKVHSVGVIQCNPDQSKHLETARMKVIGRLSITAYPVPSSRRNLIASPFTTLQS
jgi:tRNA nucleotidyltransferase/poly(A) polymerase